jgi:hypothetical protein
MIEFGGHPNPRSIVDHIRIKNDESRDNHPISLVYMQATGAVGLAICLLEIDNDIFSDSVISFLQRTVPPLPAQVIT